MKRKPVLYMLYPKNNADSIPPLLSTLEKYDLDSQINIRLITHDSLININNFLITLLLRDIKNSDLIIIAFSFLTPNVREVEEVTKGITSIKRKHKNKIVLLAGGPHASGDPLGTLEILNFDIVILGEGERTFPELLRTLVNRDDIAYVKGIAYKYDHEICINPRIYKINLDESIPYSVKYGVYCKAIEIMRGCPFSCKYCQTPRLTGFKPRFRTIENIVKISEVYVNHFNYKTIRFLAPNGLGYYSRDGKNPNVEKITELLEAVSSIKNVKRILLGTFPSELRPDSINEEILEVLKKYVSNKRLVIGIQSGSDRVLEKIGRNHTVQQGIQAVKLAMKYGFKVCTDVIFGLPDENIHDMMKTLKLIKEIMKHGVRVRVHTFMPLPSTPYWFSKSGSIPHNIREKLDVWKKSGRIEGDYDIQEDKINPIIDNYRNKLLNILK